MDACRANDGFGVFLAGLISGIEWSLGGEFVRRGGIYGSNSEIVSTTFGSREGFVYGGSADTDDCIFAEYPAGGG